MISDPKLPFAGEPTRVGTEADMPGEAAPEAAPKVLAGSGAIPPAGLRAAAIPSRTQIWLRRVGVLLFVFLCATLGVMLMILPWRPEWADNPLLLPHPGVREVVSSGFVRGLVTGLGLLNVWIGFWEALQYHEE